MFSFFLKDFQDVLLFQFIFERLPRFTLICMTISKYDGYIHMDISIHVFPHTHLSESLFFVLFIEASLKRNGGWKARETSRVNTLKSLQCHFSEKWDGKSVHCHLPLSRKQIVVNSETDWAEPWAHKFTLRAWKPIVTSRSRHSWWWLRFNGAAHLENNDKLILIWFYFCKQLLFLFFRWSRRKIPGKLSLYCISKWSCWRVLWESAFIKTWNRMRVAIESGKGMKVKVLK